MKENNGNILPCLISKCKQKDLMDQKMTGAKKVTLTKNQFFHACQPREVIFYFYLCSGFIFMTEVRNFTKLVPNCVTSESNLF